MDGERVIRTSANSSPSAIVDHTVVPRRSEIIVVTPKKVAALFFCNKTTLTVTSGGSAGGLPPPWDSAAVGKRATGRRTNAVGFVLIAAFVRSRYINARRSTPLFPFFLSVSRSSLLPSGAIAKNHLISHGE